MRTPDYLIVSAADPEEPLYYKEKLQDGKKEGLIRNRLEQNDHNG